MGYHLLDPDYDRLTSGEATLGRAAVIASTIPLTSGTLRLAYFTAKKTETITTTRTPVGGTFAAATPTLVRLGIYTADAAGALIALVASTTDDTALFASPTTPVTKALTASWDKVAGQRYAAGWLVVSGATVPTICGHSLVGGTGAEAGVSPRKCGFLNGLSDLAGATAAGSIQNSSNCPYIVFVP